jgi:hypothetical protein
MAMRGVVITGNLKDYPAVAKLLVADRRADEGQRGLSLSSVSGAVLLGL